MKLLMAILAAGILAGCTSADVKKEYNIFMFCDAGSTCEIDTELLLEDLDTTQQPSAQGAQTQADVSANLKR